MAPKDPYIDLLNLLKNSKKVCVGTHINPDGDGIGSMLAMKLALESMGKSVVAYNPDPVPNTLVFLPGSKGIVRSIAGNENFDAAIMVDCAEPQRAGKDFEELVKRTKFAVIDHHMYHNLGDAVLCLDDTAASAGAVVLRLLNRMGVEINAEIAMCVYTTLVVDTGFFKYSSTTPEIFSMAAYLVRAGADPWLVARNLEESYSEKRMHLLGESLRTLNISMGGRFSSMSVTTDMLKKTGADIGDSDEFAIYPRSILGVELAALYREVSSGKVKISLRSKSYVNVAEIAHRHGGGGHRNAAGFTVDGDLEKAKRVIEEEASKALK
jgi:phosphoesterase RecJ-like protein